MFNGFECEQEPILSYKSRALMQACDSGVWAVVYTERVLLFRSAFLMAAYVKYHLWDVPPDVIACARELGMGMTEVLGSRTNVLELLEFLEIIESSLFEAFPNAC